MASFTNFNLYMLNESLEQRKLRDVFIYKFQPYLKLHIERMLGTSNYISNVFIYKF